jgi:hypothetical protein
VACGRQTFFFNPVSREGRENRPQLRCGNALQTPSAPSSGVHKANLRVASEVKARGEDAHDARKLQIPNAKSQIRLRLKKRPVF